MTELRTPPSPRKREGRGEGPPPSPWKGEGRRSTLVAALALALAAAAAPAPARARAVPALSGPVLDEARLLEVRDRRRLEALSRAAWEQPPERRVQLQYLVVSSLDGEDIEGFAVRVFEAWKLGDRDKDNGVLLVVSREDRKVRIETGYGAEGALTDAQSGRIIRNVLAPAFREGRYGDGLYEAGVQILSALGALPQGVSAPRPRASGGGLPAIALLALVLMALAVRVVSGFGPHRRWGGPWGGGWGGWSGGGGWGGGGGGWGGGGGGWGGGGGRSGGGGASGGW